MFENGSVEAKAKLKSQSVTSKRGGINRGAESGCYGVRFCRVIPQKSLETAWALFPL